jgi:hypothetical protein
VTPTTLATIIHGVLSLTFAVAATVLLALHDIDSTTAMALFAGAGLGTAGTASTMLALKVPVTRSGGS